MGSACARKSSRLSARDEIIHCILPVLMEVISTALKPILIASAADEANSQRTAHNCLSQNPDLHTHSPNTFPLPLPTSSLLFFQIVNLSNPNHNPGTSARHRFIHAPGGASKKTLRKTFLFPYLDYRQWGTRFRIITHCPSPPMDATMALTDTNGENEASTSCWSTGFKHFLPGPSSVKLRLNPGSLS
ncbi:hypothetical protein K470DRAFT_79183 [Piedraia hortae CBS 480.64]|uniref:Uncharacterized protein n=1 Tax=Piedraia hortae CBS 480.64 TaxID=1314780 RepID=A0A6A7BYC3_9PEZI|nr:hypothetical protein K470DRAFT_79183 [Piedraia hortae CBS 480.64]